jgi:hypothetical protein
MKYLMICLTLLLCGCELSPMVIAKGEQVCSGNGGLYEARLAMAGSFPYIFQCKDGRVFRLTEEEYENIQGKVVEDFINGVDK